MKKYTAGFLAINCALSLSAMEVINLSEKSSSINDYGSLTEKTFTIIQEQTKELSKPSIINSAQSYFDAMHSSLSLDRMRDSFNSLSEKHRRNAMRTMSLQLLYVHVVALCLPSDVIKNHIIRLMLDDEEEAVECFYTFPSFTQAFDLYHEIKKIKKNDSCSVGSVFAKYCKARDLILKAQKKEWYSCVPIMSQEDIAKMESLDPEVINAFLEEQEMFVANKEFRMGEKLYHCSQMALPEPWCSVVTGGGTGISVAALSFGVFACTMGFDKVLYMIGLPGAIIAGVFSGCWVTLMCRTSKPAVAYQNRVTTIKTVVMEEI